jgi:PAS domain S-box-containing protein
MKITQEELSRTNIQLEKQIDEVNNSQKRMHTLLENASELIVVFDTTQTIKYISPSVKNILGFNDIEVLGLKNFINLNEKARGDFDQNFQQILNDAEHQVKLEFSVQAKNGQRIWLEALGQNKFHDSSIEGIVFNCRDITMRRKAETEEKRSGQMQALSENSIDLIIRLNQEGRFYYVNPTIEKFTGLAPVDLVNQTIDSVSLPTKMIDFLKNTTQEIYNTSNKTHSELPISIGDEKYIFSVASIPEFGSDGQVDTILMVFHDVTDQKEIETQIKEKNKSITESINYSYNIQSSLMPSEEVIRNYFPNSFLYYAPKDIVSGDFPWLYVTEQAVYIATVDCTGHGVPGALMSFIGYFTLNNILAKNNNLNCGELLDLMHAEVQRVLRQDVADSKSRDGMDVAICKYYPSTKQLEFSGAHRPLYLIQDGAFAEVKADKYPIAGMHYKNRTNFVNHHIQLNTGDSFFIFTDGFPDQFGGPTGKEKLYSTRIQEHIANHANYEMPEMGESFDNLFTTWKGKNKQLDDVLMIGVKV